MMTTKRYIVLQAAEVSSRSPEIDLLGATATARGVTTRTGRALVAPEDIAISTSDLSAHERNDLRRDPRTVAMAEQQLQRMEV